MRSLVRNRNEDGLLFFPVSAGAKSNVESDLVYGDGTICKAPDIWRKWITGNALEKRVEVKSPMTRGHQREKTNCDKLCCSRLKYEWRLHIVVPPRRIELRTFCGSLEDNQESADNVEFVELKRRKESGGLVYIGLKNYDPQKDKHFSGSVKLPHIPRPKMKVCILGDSQHVEEVEKIGLDYMDIEEQVEDSRRKRPHT
eukprot:Gb_22055 [translate_table: standard]